MVRGRKCSVGIVSALASYLTIFSLHGHFAKGGKLSQSEESQWIASSPSWLDRQTCRWMGVCGALHLKQAGWTANHHPKKDPEQQPQGARERPDPSSYWSSGTENSSQWSADERLLRKIPSYVYEYAPYVHLFSAEEYWPCDIANHLVHTTPYLNYTAIPKEDLTGNITLDNLEDLNEFGRFTYLQSDDNVEERPKWLGGSKNIPSSLKDPEVGQSRGPLQRRRRQRLSPRNLEQGAEAEAAQAVRAPEPESERQNRTGGRSSAPAILIVVNKGHGVVDAFWFYFYSYNLGNQVLNTRFGNHVGDWEHSVVRFKHGVPKAVFLSEHNFGEAYSYEAMEKIGKRPVIYSAVGTHAMYATPGLHPYVLPWGLLHDETDRGPLWDPALNEHGFVYNHTAGILRSSTQTPKAPVSWFNFSGRWGDKIYPLSDPRQYRFAGQFHYVTGPLGPKFKNLGRSAICQGGKNCVIKDSLSWFAIVGVKTPPRLDEEGAPENDTD